MSKKAIIGIIAGVLAFAVALVCILVLPGDKENKNKEETETEEKVESPITVDGEPGNMGSVAVNARTKTCLANQREITSQLNNNWMSDMIELDPGDEYELRTNEDGTGGEWVCINAQVDQSEIFYELFQDVPYCPVGGNVIKVTVTTNEYGNTIIVTECCGEHEAHNNDYEE
jgi:hypothetical protein